MPSPVNLAAFAGDQPWSVLQALTHWHRADRPLRRCCLFAAAGDSRPGAGPAPLARFLKETFPDLRVEVREGGAEPGSVRAHLEVWHRGDPAADWVLNLTGVADGTAWAAEPWIGRPSCRVIQKRPDGSWIELRRDADGRVETEPLTELRREDTDGLTLPVLLRSFSAGTDLGEWQPAESLPLVAITEAAIRHGWAWREAFEAAGVPAGEAGEDLLFQRYLAALLATLGVTQVGRTTSEGGLVWLNHGGRLLLLDAGVAPDDTGPAAGAEPDGPVAPSRHPLGRLVTLARRWPGLPLEPVWIRPACRATSADRELATELGVRLLDESDGPEFPSRLARLAGLPLTTEGSEIERLLRHHLAASGRLRVFGPESSVLRGRASADADPVVADVEGWLEQVRVARRQNWQAWRHAGHLHVRVPASGASSPAEDWRLLVGAVLRLGPDAVKAEAGSGAVTLTLADEPEVRRRLAAWFRPFLNTNLTFVAARDRLAAEARAAMEAPPTREPRENREAAPRPAAPPSPPPRRPGTPPSPPPAGRRPPTAKPKTVSLEDLDRALNDALGG